MCLLFASSSFIPTPLISFACVLSIFIILQGNRFDYFVGFENFLLHQISLRYCNYCSHSILDSRFDLEFCCDFLFLIESKFGMPIHCRLEWIGASSMISSGVMALKRLGEV